MNSFIDIIMIVLFVLFMIFIFGGYHKNKSLKREEERLNEEKEEELK
jgi:Ca2+/Na+ antiporter